MGRYTSGSPGLLALPGYIGTDGMRNIIFASIGAGIAFIVSFVVSFLLGTGEEGQQEADSESSDKISQASESSSESAVYAPINGQAVLLSEVNDPTFSEEVLGKGIAIVPDEGKVYAPFDGEINTVFDTKHALGMTNKDGVELLIHVGLDTVNLKGQHYEAKVSPNEKYRRF